METAQYFREKAAQCRRLSETMINQADPAAARLVALAEEFEAKAKALEEAETLQAAVEKEVESEMAPDLPVAALKPPETDKPD